MAVEGNARQVYYSSFNEILKNPKFNFTQRSRRPPRDAINSLISFGNSIIYSITLSQIYQTQLDSRIGYLHSTNGRSFSLNLDVSEIFKPILVDRAIFSVVNKKIITEKDFQKDLGGIILKENSRKTFAQELTDKLSATIKLPNLSYRVSYKRLIRLELYKLQKHLTEGIVYEPFMAKW
jgi:CRISPR-associated protein Cas1